MKYIKLSEQKPSSRLFIIHADGDADADADVKKAP
jgi:hypothetical protein